MLNANMPKKRHWEYLWTLVWLGFITGSAPVSEARQPIRVLVVDTGLDVQDKRFNVCGYKDFTGEGITDQHSHGTHVTGIVTAMVDGRSDVCVIPCKYYTESQSGLANLRHTVECFKWGATQHIDVLNYSGGGPEFDQDEYVALKSLQVRGVQIITAAGNEHADVDLTENFYYPGSYHLPGAVTVGALEHNGLRLLSSNYGKAVNTYAPGEDIYSTTPNSSYGYMTGTSQATAVVTGSLLRQRLGLTAIPYNTGLWRHLQTFWRRRQH